MVSQASLNRKPGKNWIELVKGELPPYVREVARAIERSGKTLEQAIKIAIGRIKRWASGVGVSAQVQAKAAKALAQWNALKARAHASSSVKATVYDDLEEVSSFLSLTTLEDLYIQSYVENLYTQRSLSLSRIQQC